MARTDNFTNFATDVADSIREMTGKTDKIPASEFDTEIRNIQTGSSEDYEITDGTELFAQGRRVEAAPYLLKHCNNMTKTYRMFYNAGSKLTTPVDLSDGQLDTLTHADSYKEMFYNASGIPSIKMSSTSSVPTSTTSMFFGCSALEEVDLTGTNYTNIKYMGSMFRNCTNLKKIELGQTEFPLVTDLSYFVSGCNALPLLDLSRFTFAKTVTLASMCQDCTTVEHLVLPKTAGATNMSYLFYGCDKLKSIDFNGEDMSNVTNINYMFASSSTDTTIEGTLDVDLSNMDLSKVTSAANRSYFLQGNKCIRTIDLSPFDPLTFTGTSLNAWFQNASSLIEIDVTPIHTTSALTSLRGLFDGCMRLKKIIGFENFETSGLTGTTAIYKMFTNCHALTEVNVSALNTANITTPSSNPQNGGYCYMFANCKSLKTLDISNFVINATNSTIQDMFNGCESLEILSLPDFTTATSLNNISNLFYNCLLLGSIDEKKIPWDRLTNISNAFRNSGLTKFEYEPVTTPTPKWYNANALFRDCKNLTKVDARFLSQNTNTNSNSMQYLFSDCENLEEVDISNYFNMNNTSAASYMFKNCKKLKTVKFHHVPGEYICNREGYWSGVPGMFDGCESLEVLDLRYLCWITTQQTGYGSYMFRNCRKLRKLDLRGSNYGQLGPGNSSWNDGVRETFLNCGVDNDTPTIIYVSDATCRGNIISAGNRFGLGWSNANVILVEDPEQDVDMS